MHGISGTHLPIHVALKDVSCVATKDNLPVTEAYSHLEAVVAANSIQEASMAMQAALNEAMDEVAAVKGRALEAAIDEKAAATIAEATEATMDKEESVI